MIQPRIIFFYVHKDFRIVHINFRMHSFSDHTDPVTLQL